MKLKKKNKEPAKRISIISIINRCEICHEHIATKIKYTLTEKNIRVCSKCYKITKY